MNVVRIMKMIYIYNKVEECAKFLLLSVFFVFLPLALHAQTIIGHVVDEATGENLGFASVQYKGRHIATITDLNGRFSIEYHKGWKLTVSAVGYKSRTYVVEGDMDKLFVSLKEDNRSLKEVTVHSKRSRYKRKNNPERLRDAL